MYGVKKSRQSQRVRPSILMANVIELGVSQL